jgi:hypothetical protein
MKLVQLLYWHQLIVVVAPLVSNCKSSIVVVLVDCHSIQRWNCIELLYRNQLIVVVEPTRSMHVDYHSYVIRSSTCFMFLAQKKKVLEIHEKSWEFGWDCWMSVLCVFSTIKSLEIHSKEKSIEISRLLNTDGHFKSGEKS